MNRPRKCSCAKCRAKAQEAPIPYWPVDMLDAPIPYRPTEQASK